jgi:D-alanine-D-alanine ligase
MLELLRIPYTGSRVLTLALALDKPMTKRIFAYHDLPTPAFQVFERLDEPRSPELLFPLFVKPSREGTGMGVTADSIVTDDASLRRQIAHVFARYDQPALVEHYIEGREVTVGVVGNLVHPAARRIPADTAADRVTAGLHFFPPLEVNLSQYSEDEGGVYTNRMKVELAEEFHYFCPAPLSPEQVSHLNWLTASVFRVTGCQDVARVDFRLDKHDQDRPYILEINPLPGLNAGYSDLCIEAAAGGWSYAQLINTIVEVASERYGLA